MAEILTLDRARSALNWQPGQNPDREAELVADYIPTVNDYIEQWCGRMEDRTEWWFTTGPSPITTPWPVGTVKSVSASGCPLTGWTFAAPVLTVTDAYSGELLVIATDLPTPAPVILAAKIILAQLWNADKQGRASGSQTRTEPTSSGYAIPNRAATLLEPYMLPGFA